MPRGAGSGSGSGGGGGDGGSAITAITGTPITQTTGYGDLNVIQFDGNDTALAFGLTGDAFPRIVIMADPTDGVMYLGDGTADPTDGNAALQIVSDGEGGFNLRFPGGVQFQGSVEGAALILNSLFTGQGSIITSANESGGRFPAQEVTAGSPYNVLMMDDSGDAPVFDAIGNSNIADNALSASKISGLVAALSTLTALAGAIGTDTVLIGNGSGVPTALAVGASHIVGRAASGDIVALTAAQVKTILGATVTGNVVPVSSAHTTAAGEDILAVTTGNSDLTVSVAIDNCRHSIKKIDSGTGRVIIVASTSGKLVDGATSYTLNNINDAQDVACDSVGNVMLL